MSHNGSAREPFGQVAIRKGYVSEQQVHEALVQQRCLKEKGEKHKLIGMVLLEMGALGTTELIDVLKHFDGHHANGAPHPHPQAKV
ncbi:MAG: hypothetical protein HYY17_04010 [Planctomycetes bacterium]|nr:hypothetical protein [Planctomycetota bacterium]